MKVYVVIERSTDMYNYSHEYEIVGIFGNLENAKEIINDKIKDITKNDDYVEDIENKEENWHKIVFCGYQENWNDFIEYYIVEKEVF